MSQLIQEIETYIHELSNVPVSDPLVHCADTDKQILTQELIPGENRFPADLTWNRLLKSARDMIRQADTNPLCLVSGRISWILNGKQVLTPVLLTPVSWKFDKVSGEVCIVSEDEKREVNPFLKYYYREQTGENLTWEEEVDVLTALTSIYHQLVGKGFQCELEQEQFIGNLHYHRFHLLRELEGVLKASHVGNALQQLLGEVETKPSALPFSERLLTDADTDQLEVFKAFEAEDLVVQGPPGTGKSQVILNLIGKSMEQSKRVLILSEKRAALNVLVKKLEQLQLGSFAYVAHSQSATRDFLAQLEQTWKELEIHQSESVSPDTVRDRLQGLQLFLDRLNQPELLGGVSFSEFNRLAAETPYQQVSAMLEVPTISEWLQRKVFFQELELETASLTSLSGFKQAFFHFEHGDQKLWGWKKSWDTLAEKLTLTTWGDLQELLRISGRCQLVANDFYKPYLQLSRKSADKKKWERQVIALRAVSHKLDSLNERMTVWKKRPSGIQVEQWKTATSFLGKRKRRKEIREYVHGGEVNLEQALTVWTEWNTLREELFAIEQFFIRLGLDASLPQVEAAHYVFRKLDQENSTLAEIAEIPSEKRHAIIAEQETMYRLKQELESSFDWQDGEQVGDFLGEKIRVFEKLIPFREGLKQIPNVFFKLTHQVANTEEMQAVILKSNRLKLEAHFPELARHTGVRFLERIHELIRIQQEGFMQFAKLLRNKQAARFAAFETILRTPAPKLSSEEKLRKARLKKGKALLVKEFAKSRRHISIRELLESDARPWIEVCFPVWLSTPGQVADHFPLETEVFDMLIIDEASQMPLPNAIGSLFRSERVLIAGDEQQMSPTNFFGKKIQAHDVLHQASFYLKGKALRHHYRSMNERLIAFSNRHFYKNELLVYPGTDRRPAVFHHLVEDGIYADRVNRKEAEALVQQLAKTDLSKTIGVVAFSKEQTRLIRELIPADIREQLLLKEEENTFFLKALEEVQGDEADVVIAGLGYGKLVDGSFPQRFGPLNHATGFKRLNVLLTRARESFHFFTSVTAADFPMSANENVNLLRLYLHFLAEEPLLTPLQFPFGIKPVQVTEKQLTFSGLEQHLPNVIELMVFVKVFENRGWKIELV